MNIENILELFKIVDSGISVVHNRINTWTIDGKEVEKLKKVWQFEKVSEHEYCYKTFDGYGKGTKNLFFIDTSKADRHTKEYYDNFREAMCNIMLYIYGDREMLESFISESLLLFNGFELNYTNKELLEDRQENRLYKYRFTSFKTRQTLGSNKDGENAIREVLNTHISKKYPLGIRHDEYMTSSSRADSIVFSMALIHIYEIKSKKDSFTRLEDQIRDYRKYADRITIVLDIKKRSAFIKNHAHKYKDIEVLFYYGVDTELETASKGKNLIPTSDRFDLLWKDELYEQVLWFIPKISKLSASKLSALASNIFTKAQALDITKEILYTRHKKSIGLKRMNRGSVNMEAILMKSKVDKNVLQDKAQIFLKKNE